MKQFRKIDQYLLQHYPAVWETRAHIFVPIGLGLALFLFICPVLSGWSLKDELPSNTLSIYLMIAPVLIYLIYWFIAQSRCKTIKADGNQSLSSAYFHFLSYILVLFTAFLILVAIPLGNYQKVRNAINEEDAKLDIKNLNLGNTLVNDPEELNFDSYGTVTFTPRDFSYNYYYKHNNSHHEPITVNFEEANRIISDYLTSYNKYTWDTIDKASIKMFTFHAKPTDFAHLADTVEVVDTVNTGEYTMTDEFICNLRPYSPYFYHDYGDLSGSKVENKISWILSANSIGWYFEFMFPWFWKLLLLSITGLALLIWIFKNVQPYQFILGFIAICLTPVLLFTIDKILFDMLRLRGDVVYIFSGIILALYLIYMLIIFSTYFAPRLNNIACIFCMQLQFFLPLLPFLRGDFSSMTGNMTSTENI